MIGRKQQAAGYPLAAWALGANRSDAGREIARATLGVQSASPAHPVTLSDLQCCLSLLETFPAARAGLNRLAKVTGEWGRVVAHWLILKRIAREDPPRAVALLQSLVNP